MSTAESKKLLEVAARIREMREICSLTAEEMAEKTEVSLQEYLDYEAGKQDFPFTFIHKCALAFNLGISDLLEGQSANLSSYTVTRKGQGQETAKEEGISIQNLAPLFRKKIAEPYWVRYDYDENLQNKPIHLTKHSGQEFDFVMSGRLKIQIGDNVEILSEGDSIYYNSSTPHGMIAVDGRECLFVAVVLPGEDESEPTARDTIMAMHTSAKKLVVMNLLPRWRTTKDILKKSTLKMKTVSTLPLTWLMLLQRRIPKKLLWFTLTKTRLSAASPLTI